ncbi:MAG: AAA family ATPase [Jatrophihabitans sp.]|uniref:AAA family ATPase n=1 Tax=Jatrophihabitans sp. TaxID=1932789 RepID=UPI003F7F89F6
MTDFDAARFATDVQRFLDWAQQWSPERPENEVVRLVADHLQTNGRDHSVVSRAVPVFDHVNLQTALDRWMAERGRSVTVSGIALPPHHGPIRLQQLVSGEALPPIALSAAPLVDLANGPSTTLACFLLALVLVEDELGRYVVLVNGPTEHEQGLAVEIAGLPVTAAQAVHARLESLRREHNVYRGHVLDVGLNPFGGVAISFANIGPTPRDAVVLPDEVLRRVERHALGVAAHRDRLLAAGQHLKRGLLLYGPPGTGKTHTTRYLLGELTGYTRLVLTGRALHAIGGATGLARELQPAAIILEDVDLVAEDRSFGPGSSPVLFELLDAMDGAAPDADLLFVLTTNRADLLEPALAARPGRVDVAVEIGLPDADARARLFALYAAEVPTALTDEDRQEVRDRTEGVTASFLKELVRRAVLEALHDQRADGDDGPLRVVEGRHVTRALDDLSDSSQQVTRSLLGVGNDPESLPGGGGAGMLPPAPHGRPGRVGRGWVAYRSM